MFLTFFSSLYYIGKTSLVRTFTENVSLDELLFESALEEPQKYKKEFEVDKKPVELNIWDTLGASGKSMVDRLPKVEEQRLRKKIYPLIVRFHLM